MFDICITFFFFFGGGGGTCDWSSVDINSCTGQMVFYVAKNVYDVPRLFETCYVSLGMCMMYQGCIKHVLCCLGNAIHVTTT